MKAEKDNNLIYHERTVTENLLPQLQKKSMVAQAMPIPPEKFELSADPWAKLIPFHVKKGVAIWQVSEPSTSKVPLKLLGHLGIIHL